ncbi:hypothetical protein KI387_020702, partial [Taxus chinensis]
MWMQGQQNGALFCSIHVDQASVAMKERFGQYQEVLEAGCHCAPWFFGSQIRGNLPLREQKLDVRCETKTKDNVFVTMVAPVQYHALVEKASDAFYKLSDTRGQLQAYVFDVVRSSVPKMNLDDVFEQKSEVAKAVEEELEKYFDTMKEIGAHSKSSSVFIPHGPRTVHDVAQQIRDGLLQGSHAQQLLKRAHIFLIVYIAGVFASDPSACSKDQN